MRTTNYIIYKYYCICLICFFIVNGVFIIICKGVVKFKTVIIFCIRIIVIFFFFITIFAVYYFLFLLWPDMAYFMLKCVFWLSWLINLEWNLHIWAEKNHNNTKTHHSNDICLLIFKFLNNSSHSNSSQCTTMLS